MKRIVCLLLCLTLMLPVAVASAVEYTLPEKMQRQIDFGNGVKGSLSIAVEGDNEWAKLLAPLKDVLLQLRTIRTEGKFQYQLYALDGEKQVGLTQLYGDDQSVYLRSALLPETLLTFTTPGNRKESILRGDGENPSFYSAALELLQVSDDEWAEKWLPAFADYENRIELWLNDFAQAPTVKRDENGVGTMVIRYELPADAIKAATKVLVEALMQDEVLLPLLREKMTAEEQAAYLEPNLMYYYAQVIDALPLTGTVVLEREMTTMGSVLRSNLVFPFPENEAGWTELAIETVDQVNTLTLTGADATMVLALEQTTSTAESSGYRGAWRFLPAEAAETPVSIAFDAMRIHSLDVDDEQRSHDITTWNVHVQPDLTHLAQDDPARQNYLDFAPVTLNLKLHYFSKNAQFSPTTLEAVASAAWADSSAKVNLTIKTYSPWVLESWPTEGAQNVADLSEEELTRLLTDLGLNGLVALAALKPAPLPVPETDVPTDAGASATDLT